jgi:uncharacterized ferritin-like protein (DUF455 family)
MNQPADHHLPGLHLEGGLFRVDSAAVLKRFFHLERALAIACAGWIPAARRLETKLALAKAAWEDALTADDLRHRVFELKYPDRTLDLGVDARLVELYCSALHAPSAVALLRAQARVLLPALATSYREYLTAADEIADAPTRRFLRQALDEVEAQISAFENAASSELDSHGEEAQAVAEESGSWIDGLTEHMSGGTDARSGGELSPAELVIAPGRPWQLAEDPGRDERYLATSFYWPDNFEPSVPYGVGLQLQLRSAVSHLNEVWAVDTAAANLVLLSPELGWEFVVDAARWVYDESRHMTMGKSRLERWGLQPAQIPLGGFIYEACRGQDPILRLAMLAYFETKNIGKKRDRTNAFHELGDEVSARDMDFDWADEGIHAAYGRKWMRALLEKRGRRADEWPELLEECEALVAQRVAAASEAERAELKAHVHQLIERATGIAEGVA